MAKQQAISMSTTALLAKLSGDLDELLKLRDENHYRRGRPDEYDEDYDMTRSDHDGAWEDWADATYSNNNRMGRYIGDAQAIVKALQKWWEEVKPEGED